MSNLRIFEPRFNEPMDQMFRRLMAPWHLEKGLGVMDIRVDVVEKDYMYKVQAELPGVAKDDIKVTVEGNMVQIEAETKQEKETKGEGGKLLRSERYYGAMSRAFTLAQDIDEDKVVASYADGVLKLDLPKKASTPAKTRQIKIQ